MLITACVGFGVSVGLWFYWCKTKNAGTGLLGLALGLSHGSFILLSVYHFTKG